MNLSWVGSGWLACAALAGGCASVGSPFQAHLEAPSARVRECAGWYAALDQTVDRAALRDAQYAPVAGFPYLRVDRSFAGVRERAAKSDAAYMAYVERLGELDLEAREHEIRNLPRERLEEIAGFDPVIARAAALQRTRDCGRLLRELDLVRPEARPALLEQARVPDEYSTFGRVAGLYWLTRYAFVPGIRRWEAETRAALERQPDDAVLAVRYAPRGSGALPRRLVAAVLARANFDPLRRVQLSERELDELAAVYAPSFEIVVAGDYDRFGQLRWRRGAETPEVDASQLVVYVQAAQARYGEASLLQLVYTIWFPERPPSGAFDMLAGRLDGLVWRVTLAPDGEPLLYDSIHPCGCYHMFFPTPRAQPRPAPDEIEEWAFVPQVLARVAEGERPVVTLASGSHYIERVALVRGPDSLTRYALHPYNELRSLPRSDGGSRGAFGPDGLVAGTERMERWFFWPMGVPSAGAMRQWGRHATAFVGRRHFDDADLLERRFELDLGAAP
jgi:hypothetical protein